MATSVSMATRTPVPLLILMLWCHTTAGYFQQRIGSLVTNRRWFMMRSDGVYLVTMVADPNGGRVDLRLRINSNSTNFTAFGTSDIIGGLTVAIPMNGKDIINADPSGSYTDDSAALLGVVLVSNNKSDFRTLRCDPEAWMSNANSMAYFYQTLLSSGEWATNPGDMYWITVPSYGMYWVSARPDAASKTMTIMVKERLGQIARRELFRVFLSRKDIALSASGAFQLSAYNPIGLESEDMKSGRRKLQTGTILSFVKLSNNSGYAYTALTNNTGWYYGRRRVEFGNPITNQGNMYSSGSHSWTIKKSGVYIVSIRGDPVGDHNMVLLLLYNSNYIFRAFSENGVPSGQDCVFYFNKDSTVAVTADHGGSNVDWATMVSIAFVASE